MRLLNKPSFALLFLALVWNPCYAELADRDKPVHVEADRVSIDDARQIATFEGNVRLVQGTMNVHGDKLVVVQDKEGNMHGTVTGNPASFRQKREGVDEYIEGYGNRIEYDTRTGTIEFFGQARIKRQEDEVRGDYITYNSKTEIFEVHSAPDKATSAPGNPSGEPGSNRVHVIIQPRHAGPAPAPSPLTIKPDDTLNAPKKIDE
ncbi:MAG: lipopolysaccharide transport periplasmic protein LptA [Gallionellaceae bacterium]